MKVDTIRETKELRKIPQLSDRGDKQTHQQTKQMEQMDEVKPLKTLIKEKDGKIENLEKSYFNRTGEQTPTLCKCCIRHRQRRG